MYDILQGHPPQLILQLIFDGLLAISTRCLTALIILSATVQVWRELRVTEPYTIFKPKKHSQHHHLPRSNPQLKLLTTAILRTDISRTDFTLQWNRHQSEFPISQVRISPWRIAYHHLHTSKHISHALVPASPVRIWTNSSHHHHHNLCPLLPYHCQNPMIPQGGLTPILNQAQTPSTRRVTAFTRASQARNEVASSLRTRSLSWYLSSSSLALWRAEFGELCKGPRVLGQRRGNCRGSKGCCKR